MRARCHVAALTTTDATLAFGAPAAAHGSHDVPAPWWDVTNWQETTDDTRRLHDAAQADGVVIEATSEGLSFVVDGLTIDLIASRALRLVTAG